MVARRSTCLRRQVGAILVKDKRILATGYNGAPSGLKHCEEVGCLRADTSIPSGQRHELCRGLHAEQNAIIQAAYHGFSIRGATLYCTNKPCVICSKMLINAGLISAIKRCSPDGKAMIGRLYNGILFRMKPPAEFMPLTRGNRGILSQTTYLFTMSQA